MVIVLLLSACKMNSNEGGQSNGSPVPFKVNYFGALKNMMHQGDISSKVALSDVENIEHLYAIGAFENLKGEIQIIDGRPYNSFVSNGRVYFDHTFDRKATLLVYAEVKAWNSYPIPVEIKTYEQLEKHIAIIAEENNMNLNEPFPFMIEGSIESFDWHVINWKDGDKEHTHEKHIHSGCFGTIKNRDVELLGFYSNAHHTIFTHHSTNMHIHVKTKDNEIAGHLDGLLLGKGMRIKLPVG